MRIAIVTDAWHPQVNGVVTTYANTARELRALGHEVCIISPAEFLTAPCPTYPSIRLSIWPWRGLARRLDAFRSEAVHVATEGPLGHAARSYLRRRGLSFTTSFHTQFPEYIRMRAPIPTEWTYRYLRRFHTAAVRTLVPTGSQRSRLAAKGFDNLEIWSRGVDTEIFKPREKTAISAPRPIAAYLGRVAVEKNIDAFLRLELPGSKLVIGDGPDLSELQRRFPEVHFLGEKHGEDLARHLAAADVFVFPSKTDTFGIVLLEAMACGVPVAAYPVTGPIDVVRQGATGVRDEDLGRAVAGALQLDGRRCAEFARGLSWRKCAESFVSKLAPCGGSR